MKMHIACNIDSNYVRFCSIMLVSLFENNKGESFDIHIVSQDLSEEGQKALKDIVCGQYKQRVYFYFVNTDLANDFPIDPTSHISISTYLRLFLGSVLPSSLSKVLYLDCDIIIRSSIAAFWNIDLTGYAIGCVEDMWSDRDENYSRLGYSKDFSYFNAGVLLVNLDYWRQNDLENEFTNYVKHNAEKLLFNDQDVLNEVLHDKKLFIPFKWNMQDGFFRSRRRIRKETWDILDKELCNPAILHFTGSKKPWHYKCIHPYKSEFYVYQRLTKWKDCCPEVNYYFLFLMTIQRLATSLKIKRRKFRKFKKQWI